MYPMLYYVLWIVKPIAHANSKCVMPQKIQKLFGDYVIYPYSALMCENISIKRTFVKKNKKIGL